MPVSVTVNMTSESEAGDVFQPGEKVAVERIEGVKAFVDRAV